MVYVRSLDGSFLKARVLIDSGSEASFVSNSFTHRLGIPKCVVSVPINSLGDKPIAVARNKVTLQLRSKNDLLFLTVTALILRKLGITAPSHWVSSHKWNHLPLADPDYGNPRPVDIILGADAYGMLLLEGVRRGSSNSPIAFRTIFGWVVTGAVKVPFDSKSVTSLSLRCDEDLSSLLQRFWEQEEVNVPPAMSVSEQECERQFVEGCRRHDSGRYIKRMKDDMTFSAEYSKFMLEYEARGHMRLLAPSEICNSTHPVYYIPHHAIWKASDGKRKLRVVFNASDKPPSRLSLNETVFAGPKLQNDLAAIITRWRFFRIVFSADIEMMFRQIRVDDRDIDLQRIVWQPPGAEQINHYQLLTVTYGMSCAPFLAIRTLLQLAADEAQTYPEAATILQKNMYVDDVFSGASDEVSAIQLQKQLVDLLKSAGMHLKKWTSNQASLLNQIPESDRLRPDWLQFKSDNPICALGILWDPFNDEFRFKAPPINTVGIVTKRKILSAISKLFDPLGWLSPITIVGKILMQDLWKAQVDWDLPIPENLLQQWSSFQASLSNITSIHCPRWVNYHPGDKVELHGFGDASQHAFAATVFVRIQSSQGDVHTHLLLAKTRVAPVKTITIPKLELCAALLTIKLINKVKGELGQMVSDIHVWSDSVNALSWILTADPSQWPTFVANRVSQIQRTLPNVSWHYVPEQT